MQFPLSPRNRKSPFYEAQIRHGMTHFSIYNHMVLPVSFGNLDAEYEALMERVSLWDVGAERQVEVVGPDALTLIQYVSARDMSDCRIGRVRYAPLCDNDGIMLNDPMILKLAEDRYWISIADSDVLFWCKGIALAKGYDCKIFEPDVSPLAVQGPRAEDTVADYLGEWVRDIPFFGFEDVEHDGIPMLVCRSGWSGQGGFELFLQDGSRGLELWDAVWKAGEKYGIHPGAPTSLERIESGLFSYRGDCGGSATPLEVGLEKYLSLDRQDDFIGKEALLAEKERGSSRRLVKVLLSGDRMQFSSEHPWPAFNSEGQKVGEVRMASWSPLHDSNLALALVSTSVVGGSFFTETPEGEKLEATHLSMFPE